MFSFSCLLVEIDDELLTRPLDMPTDTTSIQFEEEDMFFWNLVNHADLDKVTKVKLKKMLVMDKHFQANEKLMAKFQDIGEDDETVTLRAPASKRNVHL
jgi:hypothetical protein